MQFNLKIKSTNKVEFIDLTDQINNAIEEGGIKEGLCTVFVKHTTAAIIVGEAESDLLSDMEKLVNLIPKTGYSHGHGDPGHTPAHILSSLIGQNVTLPVKNRALDLGTWQSILLVELHGPRSREVSIVVTS